MLHEACQFLLFGVLEALCASKTPIIHESRAEVQAGQRVALSVLLIRDFLRR
jgi:hypothetical protein